MGVGFCDETCRSAQCERTTALSQDAPLRYGSSLPQELLNDYPALQLDQVYSLTLSWHFSEARRILQSVRANLMNGTRTAKWRAAGLDVDEVLRKQVYCEMQLAILRDEMVQAEALARQWLAMDGNYTLFDDAVSQTSLIYAQREQFDCRSLAAASRARTIFADYGNRWGSIWHDCIIAAGHLQIGHLERARTTFQSALETAIEIVGRTNPTTAMPALHLSEVLYEVNEVDAARALTDEFLLLAGQTGLVDQLVAGYLTKVRIAALDSIVAALRVLEEGEEIGVARGFDRLIGSSDQPDDPACRIKRRLPPNTGFLPGGLVARVLMRALASPTRKAQLQIRTCPKGDRSFHDLRGINGGIA